MTLPRCLCAFTGGAGGIIIGLATQQLLTNAFMGLSLVRHLNGRLRPSNSRAAVSYLQQGQPVAVCSLQDMSLADANDVLSKVAVMASEHPFAVYLRSMSWSAWCGSSPCRAWCG